jgi:hypothetical protein
VDHAPRLIRIGSGGSNPLGPYGAALHALRGTLDSAQA